jgi:hypothetical protein
MHTVESVIARCFYKVGQKGGTVSDAQDIWEEAGEVYRSGIGFSIQDSALGLRYPLRRLGSLLRLPEQDREELTELGRIVIQEGDVGEVADRIRERQDASPLAVAVAAIVQEARFSGGGDTRGAMLGAVFGAYAGLESSQTGDEPHVGAVLGAIGGALAVTTYTQLQEILEARSLSWREWSEAE